MFNLYRFNTVQEGDNKVTIYTLELHSSPNMDVNTPNILGTFLSES